MNMNWKTNDRRIKQRQHWTPKQRAGVTLHNASEYLRSLQGQFGFGVVVIGTQSDHEASNILQTCMMQVAAECRNERAND
jgi:hypothetical protein